jgi:hypothetical protein
MTLTEWYFDKSTSAKDLTDEQFSELIVSLDFDLREMELENGVKIYYLIDMQKANIGHIGQDIFYANHSDYLKNPTKDEMWIDVKDQIINRLEVYLYDYFERDN